MTQNVQEIVQIFKAAKNPNAAVKSFLKREVKRGDEGERFAKDFRDALLSPQPGRFEGFINKHSAQYELHLMVLARYAFPDLVLGATDKIFESYAEDFNKTYEKQEKDVKITDKASFKRIVKEVDGTVRKSITDAGLPDSKFLRNSVFFCIFDVEVLKKVLPEVGGEIGVFAPQEEEA